MKARARLEADPERLAAACEEASTHLRFTYCRDAWPYDGSRPHPDTFQQAAPADVIIAALLKDKITYEQSISRLTKKLASAERAVRDFVRGARSVLAEHEAIVLEDSTPTNSREEGQ